MMNDGTNVSQRDIILIPFPYSDLSQTKRRPAIILSNGEYNSNNLDIICCAITSNPRSYENSVEIKSKDFESGDLDYDSRVKPNKIFTLNQNMVVKKLAKLNIKKSKEIVKNVDIIIKIDE